MELKIAKSKMMKEAEEQLEVPNKGWSNMYIGDWRELHPEYEGYKSKEDGDFVIFYKG